MRKAERAISVVVALVLGSGLVLAQSTKGDPRPKAAASASASASPSAPAPPSSSNAISLVAAEVVKGLGAVPAGAIVVAAPVVSDMELTKGDELAVRIATQVAGRLTAAKAHAQPLALAGARVVAGKGPWKGRDPQGTALVHLVPEIVKGSMRVTADTYPVLANGWERIRNPLPAPTAHAFATAAVDPEIRAFMAPILLEKISLHKAKHEEGDLLAVGCGDVDGDGGMELVFVSRARISVGRLRAGKVAIDRSASWHTLAPRVATPVREPLAGVVVAPLGHRRSVFVGTTDRGGVELDAGLAVLSRFAGIPLAFGRRVACARPNPEAGAFEGAVFACDAEADQLYDTRSARWDAASVADAWDRAGRSHPPLALLREPTGKLHMRRGAERQAIEGVGAQVLAADLDLDGAPEMVTTSDAAEDVVSVQSWDGGAPRVRARWPAPQGVQALAACPPEENAAPGLVVATATEVWLAR